MLKETNVLDSAIWWWEQWARLMRGLAYGQLGLICFSAGWWWRPAWLLDDLAPTYFRDRLTMPASSAAYQSVYYARFALALLVAGLALAWLLGGLAGLRRLAQGTRLYGLLGLAGLTLWVYFSAGWATQNPHVAHSHAMQWLLVLAFVTVLLALEPSPRWLVGVLLAGMVAHGLLGLLQVARQGALNIAVVDQEWLGLGLDLYEFNLDPTQSGVSVVQSGGVRFLRAYGLTPHPNLLAGGLTLALVAGLYLWLEPARRRWAAGLTAFGLWAVLLTFSRAALGGLAVGSAVTVGLWWAGGQLRLRERVAWEALGGLAVTAGLVGLVFYVGYGDLVAARAGVAAEGFDASVEARSLSDRRVYAEQARHIIDDHPWRGIGIGNFPWESHQRLRNDPRYPDLQGDNVHNLYLLAVSETGMIGGALLALPLAVTAWGVLRQARRRTLPPYAASLSGAVAGWLAIGWFEGYMWALFTHQILFWGGLALIWLALDDETTPTQPTRST